MVVALRHTGTTAACCIDVLKMCGASALVKRSQINVSSEEKIRYNEFHAHVWVISRNFCTHHVSQCTSCVYINVSKKEHHVYLTA